MNINLGIGVADTTARSNPVVPTHVIGLAGQSNMQGGPDFDGGAGWPEGTVQWGRNGADNGEIVPAVGNLQHQGGYGVGKMSLAVEFAIDYLAAHPGVRILFVPGAQGGSSFESADWNKGDPAYEDFVARMNAVFAQNPGFILAGILWQHGETDAQNGAGGTYAASLDQMLADLRADITRADASTPIVIGEIPPELADDGASHLAVRDALIDTPDRVLRTALAAATGLTTYDGVHYDPASLRTLGGRHAAALAAALANDGTGNNLLTNGGFDSAADWVVSGAASIAGGVGTASNGSGYWRQENVPLEVGKTYRVTWTVKNYTTGTSAPFLIGGSHTNGSNVGGAGTHSQDLVANTGNVHFQLNCNGGSIFDIDDVSLVEL